MSEDRLEKALEAMRNENVSPEQLAGARDRVWQNLADPGPRVCAEFQPGYRDYLEGRLTANRRLLTEDHLSRCPQCRSLLAELEGKPKVVAMPIRRSSRWPRFTAWAAAAALVFALLYAGRDRIDTMLAPGGPAASITAADGGLHRLPEGILQVGAELGRDEVMRTAPGGRAVLMLADGSLVEINQRTELFVRVAWSGLTIHLQRGDIIVQAAPQRRGQLRVQTRDSVASVTGTVFAVSAGLGGSVVSVVEGSVAVTQPGVKVVLKPGEQASSNRALAYSVQDAVSWSPDAEKYLSLLASIGKIEKELARLPSAALRTQPRLLPHLPPNPVVYGAMPNIGGTISQAMALAEQQSVENPAFSEWWNSSAGRELKLVIERIQAITPLLGDEIVYVFSAKAPGAKNQVPLVLAEVKAGRIAELAHALEALRNDTGAAALPYHLSGTLMVISDSQENLQWALSRLGQGATTPFAAAIADRYRRGAGWLLGMDVEGAFSGVYEPVEAGLTGAQQMKHLFVEQRDVQGMEENEVTLTFKGPRMGMASWLASTGSGGAAEYISSDAVFSFYASTREPRQLFEELAAQLLKSSPSSGSPFAEMDAKLGVGFAENLAAAFGTESAFALEGLSATGPVWVMAALVNNPSTIDHSVRKVVEVFNAELAPEDQARRITITQDAVDGRLWTTLKSGQFPLAIMWTYDRGYLVASSDRGAALRAIAARNGGSALIWSHTFRQQLPSSAGLHPSGFAWLNTKGAFQGLETLASNPTLQKLIAERDPILVVFDGTAEQIHSASRTRLSGLLVDVMLLESLSRGRSGAQPPALQQGSPGKR